MCRPHHVRGRPWPLRPSLWGRRAVADSAVGRGVAIGVAGREGCVARKRRGALAPHPRHRQSSLGGARQVAIGPCPPHHGGRATWRTGGACGCQVGIAAHRVLPRSPQGRVIAPAIPLWWRHPTPVRRSSSSSFGGDQRWARGKFIRLRRHRVLQLDTPIGASTADLLQACPQGDRSGLGL